MQDRIQDIDRPRGMLGNHLLYYRRRSGYTQEQIAEILCLNRTTYTKYETGITEPNIAMLKKIAEVFGIDVNSLLDDGNPEKMEFSDSSVVDGEYQRLKSIFSSLDDSGREKLLNFASELQKDNIKEGSES